MIFDTHCHYNLQPLFAQGAWQTHWQKAQESGVKKSIVVGTDQQSNLLALSIVQDDPNLFAAVGIHPGESAATNLLTQLTELESHLKNPKVVAIGETGLDYFHLRHDASLTDENKANIISAQKEAFRAHILLAQKYDLPLILHVRDQQEQAYWDVLDILDEAQYCSNFVLHCVSGPEAYIQKALKMGAYISAAGNITYKNADHLRKLVKMAPQDRILIETDAPYLPPQSFRGQTCEPWMISLTAAFLEAELGISAEVTWQNAHTFFGLE